MDNEAELEISPLSQSISSGGHSVQVEMYRLEGENEWALEVMD